MVAWLRDAGLGQYQASFQRLRIDGRALLILSKDELGKSGIGLTTEHQVPLFLYFFLLLLSLLLPLLKSHCNVTDCLLGEACRPGGRALSPSAQPTVSSWDADHLTSTHLFRT